MRESVTADTITAPEARIGMIDGEIETIDARISALKSEIAKIKSEIDALDGEIAIAEILNARRKESDRG